jgi:hypothetical protein
VLIQLGKCALFCGCVEVVQPARSLQFQPAIAAVKQQQQLVATQSCLEPGSLTPEKLIATPQSAGKMFFFFSKAKLT